MDRWSGIGFPKRDLLSPRELDELVARHPDAARVAMTVDGVLLEWSETATALFGYGPEQALGRNMVDLTVPAESHPCLRVNHELHLELEQRLCSRRFEIEKMDGAGRRFLAEVHCYPVVTVDGTTTLYAFITELGDQAHSRHDPLRSADAIVTGDSDRAITEWNPAAQHLFGWARSEMVGMPIDAIVPAPLREHALTIWQQAQSSPQPVRVNTQRRHRAGNLVDVELTLTRLELADHREGATATYREIGV